jgi:hypothetical protein
VTIIPTEEVCGLGDYNGVSLTLKQHAKIVAIYEKMKTNEENQNRLVPDPTRPGEDFTHLELGISAAILQECPTSTWDGYMSGLCSVFAKVRAKAILEAIVC